MTSPARTIAPGSRGPIRVLVVDDSMAVRAALGQIISGDPRLVLMEVEPAQAEYWDRTGMRRLEFLWEAGKAFATGRAMADEALAGHGKLGFGWNVGGSDRND